MMKKLLSSCLLLITIMLMLTACGSNQTTDSKADSTTKKPLTLTVAGVYPVDHPSTQNLEQFKEKVEEKTNGQIELDLYPANQLGDYTLVYEELMMGTIDMGLISIPTQFEPNLNLNHIPYLAESYKDAEEIFAPESFLYEIFDEIHDELGIKFLGFHFEGMTGIGSVSELSNVTEPGSDKEILLRVPEVDTFRRSMEDFGFKTTAIDYAELYQALQTGVADGWAGGSTVPNYYDVGDVINYYYEYNLWFETTHLLINDDVWDTVSKENQQILIDESNDLYARSLEITEKNEKIYKEKLKDEYGVEIVEFSEEELGKFAKYIRETSWPKLKDVLDEKYYEILMENYE